MYFFIERLKILFLVIKPHISKLCIYIDFARVYFGFFIYASGIFYKKCLEVILTTFINSGVACGSSKFSTENIACFQVSDSKNKVVDALV